MSRISTFHGRHVFEDLEALRLLSKRAGGYSLSRATRELVKIAQL
jgi:hypothetical protein